MSIQRVNKVEYSNSCLLLSFNSRMFFCHLLNLFKINCFEKSFRNTIRASNNLDQVQGSCSGNTCRERVYAIFLKWITEAKIVLVWMKGSHLDLLCLLI